MTAREKRIQGLTRAQADRVAYVAALIAIEAPEKQPQFIRGVLVDWKLIHRLRAALEAGGFDWKALKAEADKLCADGGGK